MAKICGPGNSSGKALGYGLDYQGSILGVGRDVDFLHSFVFRPVLGYVRFLEREISVLQRCRSVNCCFSVSRT